MDAAWLPGPARQGFVVADASDGWPCERRLGASDQRKGKFKERVKLDLSLDVIRIHQIRSIYIMLESADSIILFITVFIFKHIQFLYFTVFNAKNFKRAIIKF